MTRRILLLLLIPWMMSLVAATPASAQGLPSDRPVMQNVFFNVFWGAATGALIGAASASMASKHKDNPHNLRDTAIQGASLGSLTGLGVGVWLLFNGITFDPDRSLIFGGGIVQLDPEPLPTPPLVFLTDPGHPTRIIGIQALVLDIHF